MQNAQPQLGAVQGQMPVEVPLVLTELDWAGSQRVKGHQVTDHSETSYYLRQSHRPLLSSQDILQLIQATMFCS